MFLQSALSPHTGLEALHSSTSGNEMPIVFSKLNYERVLHQIILQLTKYIQLFCHICSFVYLKQLLFFFLASVKPENVTVISTRSITHILSLTHNIYYDQELRTTAPVMIKLDIAFSFARTKH